MDQQLGARHHVVLEMEEHRGDRGGQHHKRDRAARRTGREMRKMCLPCTTTYSNALSDRRESGVSFRQDDSVRYVLAEGHAALTTI